MKLIEDYPGSPEELIAIDELFLARAEQGRSGETLRFWGSEEYFVVVGRAGKLEKECFNKQCAEDGIKIVRRISGGGTVLQGKGCLNYSLILAYGDNGAYRRINASFHEILTKLSDELNQRGMISRTQGVSDLATNGRKFSGNAQARKKRFFLIHGTVLLDFDINRISRYLKHPEAEPDYRKGRSHDCFVTNLNMTSAGIKDAVMNVFPPREGGISIGCEEKKELKLLVDNKYAKEDWTRCF